MDQPGEQAAFEDGPVDPRPDEADDARPRASTPVALGSIAGVALLVVAVLVAGMRLTEGTPVAEEIGFEDEVPASLAGGLPFAAVPAPVAAAVDEPVVGALVTDEPPEGMPAGCDHGTVDAGDPAASLTIVVTPDLAETLLTGPAGFGGFDAELDVGFGMDAPVPPPEPGVDFDADFDADFDMEDLPRPMPMDGFGPDAVWVEQCTWTPRGDGWVQSGGMSTVLDGRGGDFGMSHSCCEDGLATASTTLRPPDGAAWALQDRGAYWLAYPTDGLVTVPISWRFPQGPFGNGRGTTHVLWLDTGGAIIDEQFVSA